MQFADVACTLKVQTAIASAAFLILLHDFSGPSARGVLKGFIFVESQPVGGFQQTGIGTIDDLPRVVVGQPNHFAGVCRPHCRRS